MATFFKGLELDYYDFSRKFVGVIECCDADASFCINCFLWQALRSPDTGVCLFSLYHSLQHYYHVGMRLGFNISTALGKRMLIIDTLYMLGRKASQSENEHSIEDICKDGLNKLFCMVTNCCEKLKLDNKHVYLIIDDISQLLNLGLSSNEIITFLNHIKKLTNDGVSIVVATHCSQYDTDQLLLKHFIIYNSDLTINIDNLKTGFSTEVSGSIQIAKKDNKQLTGWLESKTYHYKTGGRTIKVFVPGNIDISF